MSMARLLCKCLDGWNLVTVTTQSEGSHSHNGTALSSTGTHDVDVFFLGDFTDSSHYLPSKATSMIGVS